MNVQQQKAYDALGRVQKYYQTHEVGRDTLWTDGDGGAVLHHNGEAAACVWGALIATGGATKRQYQSRVRTRVQRALMFAYGQGHSGVIWINDGYIKGDKGRMRIWLRKARAALKAGLV